jgi:diguanylate cyclase (GGDEF)-like protein
MLRSTHPLSQLLHWLDGQSKAVQFCLAAALLAITFYVDAVTGQELSLSVFYLVPVILATYALGSWWGLGFGLVAAVAERFLLAPPAIPPAMRTWNTAILLCVFAVVVWLVNTLKNTIQNAQHTARHDFLTGLLNRRAFEEHAQVELERCRRRGTPTSILYVDCDDFKQVNDSHGHREGDRVLQAIAESMKSNLRSTDILARLGGDEFAALLPDSGESQARAVAEKLQQELSRQLSQNGFSSTCSLGVAVFAAAPEDVETMIHRADELMYRVKESGKGAAQIDVFFGD